MKFLSGTFDLTAFFTMELLKDRRFSLNLSRFSRSDFSWLIISPTSSLILRLCFGAETLLSILVILSIKLSVYYKKYFIKLSVSQ